MNHDEEIALVKKLCLEGLTYLRAFCEEHGLTYFLAFGTLIGAARHAGYIPWDDDIDLLIPRDSLNRMIALSDELRSEDWELCCYEKTPGYCFPYPKLCYRKSLLLPSRFETGFLYGPSIDLFPLDYFTGSEAEAVRARDEIYHRYIHTVKKVQPYAILRPGAVNKVKRLVRHIYWHTLSPKLDGLYREYRAMDERIAQACAGDPSWAFYVVDTYQCVWRRDQYEDGGDPVYLPFEGSMFRVPCKWDEVLKIAYGDYMTLPPEEKRVAKHNYTIKTI